MKPPPFEYRAPASLDEALTLLAQHGDEARLLAGGQSLVPLLAFRLARPRLLIDLNRLTELTTVEVDGGLVLGAMVRDRVAERSELVRSHAPLLAEALPLIGHPAIRTRGTVGGSLAHADPAAELPAVVVALGAELLARSAPHGARSIAASDFFMGYFTTALEPDEILTAIRFPKPPASAGACFAEVSRRHGDFAMVGAAAVLSLDGGRVSEARLALTGVAGAPVRPRDAEQIVVGAEPGAEVFEEAADIATQGLTPPSDVHATSAYRRRLARVLVRRALDAAARRAGAPG